MKKLTQYWIVNFNGVITWFAVYNENPKFEELLWSPNCTPLFCFKNCGSELKIEGGNEIMQLSYELDYRR